MCIYTSDNRAFGLSIQVATTPSFPEGCEVMQSRGWEGSGSILVLGKLEEAHFVMPLPLNALRIPGQNGCMGQIFEVGKVNSSRLAGKEDKNLSSAESLVNLPFFLPWYSLTRNPTVGSEDR